MKNEQGFIKTVGIIFLLAFAVVLLHPLLIKKVRAQSKAADQKDVPSISQSQLANLSNEINDIINNNQDIDVAVSVVDLNTGQTQQYGLSNPFEAASTAKLITATDYLHHVEEGSASLNGDIEGSPAQYEIQQMIEVSDDNDWQALNDYLGHPDLLAYTSSIGLANYDPDDNTLPASDISLLLQKLYKGQLLDKQDSQLLLSYMAAANYNGYMGAVVPSDVKFYHKAGVLDDRIHDAAIIDNSLQPVVLVVFTKNEDDAYSALPVQTQIIQQVTTDVLNAYSIK